MNKSKPIHSLSAKIGLMGLYTVFFFVQLFFQYHAFSLSQAGQVNGIAVIHKSSNAKPSAVISSNHPSGYKKSIRLNKRYHPETSFELAAVYETGVVVYPITNREFFTTTTHVQSRCITGCPLRGPPAIS